VKARIMMLQLDIAAWVVAALTAVEILIISARPEKGKQS